MRYIIVGAGAVGGSIGGRLAQSSREVVLVARGAHAEALRARGLRLSTPDGTRTHRLPVAAGPEEVSLRADDVLVLAVKTQDAVAALDAWAPRPVEGGGIAADTLPLVCAQNGVAAERLALRRFARVYAMCVWLPATFLEPGFVAAEGTPLTGILHLGRYGGADGGDGGDAADATAKAISADLESAHFLAPVSATPMRWKYAKLLSNLANAAEAAFGPKRLNEEGTARRLVEEARAEAKAVLAAAGIDYASSEEEREVRGERVNFGKVEGPVRGGGSSWQSLARGTGSIEADYLNGEIVLLGRLHGVPTPVNEALRQAANALAREGGSAESLDPEAVAAQAEALRRR
ncbi:ketopantoate reductase family protein [Phaeacidiphilus oryzae]|uniref:ketopantoate reductase family protein n=1 Tax=Phaeacidiphilus oryzae TaxID=348818 RepID=UPI0005646C85|nr:2-dehydropantoate 2-reductase N-terminal domain-containing protein [Phaeacidiphilus oryzae]